MNTQADDVERKELAEKLKQAREYLELAQEEVADIVGISRSAISMIESGQRKVDSIELKKLAGVYQRTVSSFTGDDAMGAALSPEIEHLARTAKSLSDKDREELSRFAEFLRARSGPKNT